LHRSREKEYARSDDPQRVASMDTARSEYTKNHLT
jgi:hypothetical protein